MKTPEFIILAHKKKALAALNKHLGNNGNEVSEVEFLFGWQACEQFIHNELGMNTIEEQPKEEVVSDNLTRV